MKLPTIDRFQNQNYPGAPDWFTRFISDLNLFSETMWNILNNNITIPDNMDAQVYTQQLRAGATVADNTFSFQTTLKHAPLAVIVGTAIDQTAYSGPLTTSVYVTWSFSGTAISISGITGLTSGHTYSLTLLVF